MLNPWISLGMKAWQIGFEAQGVIALRMLRLAAGGARAEAESSRMMTEKILAAGEAQVAARQRPCVATKSMSPLARRSTSIASGVGAAVVVTRAPS